MHNRLLVFSATQTENFHDVTKHSDCGNSNTAATKAFENKTQTCVQISVLIAHDEITQISAAYTGHRQLSPS